MTKEMSPEEKLAEKKRLQLIQQESDLEYAVDLMGLSKEGKWYFFVGSL